MKNKKYKKLRYEKMAAGMSEYYQILDLRFMDDQDDEGFAYLIRKVKGIGTLDLKK